MGNLLITENGRKLLEDLKAKREAKWEKVKDLDLKSKRKACDYEKSRRLNILYEVRQGVTRSKILNNQFLLDHGWLKRAQSFRNSMEKSLDWLISRGYITER